MENLMKCHVEVCKLHPETNAPMTAGNSVIKINGKPVDFGVYRMELVIDPNDEDGIAKLTMVVAVDSIKVDDTVIVAKKKGE